MTYFTLPSLAMLFPSIVWSNVNIKCGINALTPEIKVIIQNTKHCVTKYEMKQEKINNWNKVRLQITIN